MWNENDKNIYVYNPIKVYDDTIISKSLIGQAWCRKINSYSEFESRVERGRYYIRSGFVIDFKIKDNVINSIIINANKKKYNVSITFSKLDMNNANNLVKKFSNVINNINLLNDSDKSFEFKDELLDEINEIFPKFYEIKCECTCTDNTYLCKHSAATLLGLGRMLDTNPLLIIKLRGIDTTDLNIEIQDSSYQDIIDINNNNKIQDGFYRDIIDINNNNNNMNTDRIIDNETAKRIFGIEK